LPPGCRLAEVRPFEEDSMLKLDTIDDVWQIVRQEISESLTLDYKRSDALGREDAQRYELTKDVSAFANSAGGQIVYGIVEDKRKAIDVDLGTDPAIVNREWIEQTIDSRVHPRIDGLVIKPIARNERFLYVINIPQAISRAPHQAYDRKYYKRYNFQSVAMEDYEIRDIFRRATTAEPFLTINFSTGRTDTTYVLEHGKDHTAPIEVIIAVGNRSPEPAFYTVIMLHIDGRLAVSPGSSFGKSGSAIIGGMACNVLIYKLGIPAHFPLFKEMSFTASERPLSFQIPNNCLSTLTAKFVFGYSIATPGCFVEQFGELQASGGSLRLQMEKPSINRGR
jgi:Putative DNA-binding domain